MGTTRHSAGGATWRAPPGPALLPFALGPEVDPALEVRKAF